jgi:hypothetical protein
MYERPSGSWFQGEEHLQKQHEYKTQSLFNRVWVGRD